MSNTTQYVFTETQPGKTILQILTPESTVTVNLWNPSGWYGVSHQAVDVANAALLTCRKQDSGAWDSKQNDRTGKWHTVCKSCGIQQFTFKKPEAK